MKKDWAVVGIDMKAVEFAQIDWTAVNIIIGYTTEGKFIASENGGETWEELVYAREVYRKRALQALFIAQVIIFTAVVITQYIL